jgi:uncharacterized protein (DUF2267 family)
MTRPTPEETFEMKSMKLVREIWRKELNRADKLTLYWQEKKTGNSTDMTIKTVVNRFVEIHRSRFEDYFNAVKEKTKKEVASGYIKNILEQLT